MFTRYWYRFKKYWIINLYNYQPLSFKCLLKIIFHSQAILKSIKDPEDIFKCYD